MLKSVKVDTYFAGNRGWLRCIKVIKDRLRPGLLLICPRKSPGSEEFNDYDSQCSTLVGSQAHRKLPLCSRADVASSTISFCCWSGSPRGFPGEKSLRAFTAGAGRCTHHRRDAVIDTASAGIEHFGFAEDGCPRHVASGEDRLTCDICSKVKPRHRRGFFVPAAVFLTR